MRSQIPNNRQKYTGKFYDNGLNNSENCELRQIFTPIRMIQSSNKIIKSNKFYTKTNKYQLFTPFKINNQSH